MWSGNVSRAATAEGGTAMFSKILLKEISDIGAKTKDVFEGAIADLHETVVASLLHANECHATLAIDIMDRNLYERANDCRWWTLTSVFSELLSKAQLSDQDMQAIGAILRAINNLYTVYATRRSSAWRQGSVTPVSPSSTGPIMRSAPRHHRATGSTRARATLTATT